MAVSFPVSKKKLSLYPLFQLFLHSMICFVPRMELEAVAVRDPFEKSCGIFLWKDHKDEKRWENQELRRPQALCAGPKERFGSMIPELWNC